MSSLRLYTLAFVLMAVSLPLISYGATAGIATLWGVGIAFLFAGGFIPPVARFTVVGSNAP